MLTYEALRKLREDERTALGKLLALPADFFEQVQRYLKLKETAATERWEVDAIRRELNELLELRERKLVTIASAVHKTGAQPGSLLPHELALFNALTASLKEFRNVQQKLLEPGEPRKVVAFLEDVPAFVGSDLQSYGPYKKGDVATVPAELAAALAAKKAAHELRA